MFLFALGAVIILLVSMEMIATVTLTGGGVAALLAPFVLSRSLHDRRGRWRFRPWPALGMTTIVATVLCWFVMFWAGWVLVFASDPCAVVNTSTGEPASFAARVYFSGYTISTLGIGDYIPGGPLWQVLTALASLSGFFLFTLTISFFVPMVQGEMRRRRAALLINHLGTSPQDLLGRCYHAEREDQMPVLNVLLPELIALEQVHRRYPIIHYSGSRSTHHALVLGVAMLDEAFTLLSGCEGARPDERVYAARHAIHGLLTSMDAIFIRVGEEVPPLPDTSELAGLGIELCDEFKMAQHFAEYEDRRRQLRTLVLLGGWSWGDIDREAEEQDSVRFFFNG